VTTGYTSPVRDGKHTTLAEYAWHAAQAFFHDGMIESGSEELETGAVETTKKEIARLVAMTPREIEKAFVAERKAIELSNQEKREKYAIERGRYEAMLAKVRAWTPPSEDHRGLRSFMESQLVDSIKFDFGSEPYQQKLPRHAGEWHAGQIAERRRLLGYYLEEQTKRREGVARRKAYIAALEAEFGERPVR